MSIRTLGKSVVERLFRYIKAPHTKLPKTMADYEALHAAEMKRRRKNHKRASDSNTWRTAY